MASASARTACTWRALALRRPHSRARRPRELWPRVTAAIDGSGSWNEALLAATRIAELANAGTKNEREKVPGDDNGFLWRLNAYWRYEQVDGGVLIECESVSLSRVVPFAVRLFVSPIVERIARESLERTLVSLRATLSAKRS